MNASLSVGVALDLAPHDGATYATTLRELLPVARLSEELGFACLSAGESYVFDAGDPMTFHAPNALMMLSALALELPRIRLMAGVSLLAGWTPLRLAYDAALLDQLSDGRLVLGLGLGSPRAWRAFGLDSSEVGPRLRSAVAFLRGAWDGSFPIDGVDAALVPRPVQQGGPPILVGGSLPVSARRAARIGDGYVASSGYPLDLVSDQAAHYRAQLADSRAGASPTVSVNRLAVVARTHELAVARYQEHFAPIVDAYARSGASGTPHVDGQRELCLVGTPDGVAEQLSRYQDAGVTDLQLRVRPRGTPVTYALESLELFAQHVRPHFDPREELA
ncbi:MULTISPECIES: LLM class flavin-dependent oxidoreductase [unclassified Nocardioides]|uniref:LLM class flavin-dependent oxidoreductase n=1 Tax=unclassified Nocardioides TaxID=2615069 RepID=UPI0009F100E9|nr:MULTISPECIES: LLM class flavin-dependent oxidoreductase [unclassified Nocardioides]GAW49152.1 F420-dependent oxidoreductase [Nocardioides sp. PD653-B2]GAW55640.1 F420-dependent oxidoreductase [Nocardioides sp. PD653]